MRLIALLMILASVLRLDAAPSASAEFDPAKAVPVEVLLSHDKVAPGEEVQVAVLFRVPKGFHITDRKYEMFYVEADTTAQLRLDGVRYPKGKREHDEEVYRGDVVVRGRLRLKPGASGTLSWPFRAGYQICSETGDLTCYMPIDKELVLKVPVAASAAEMAPIHPELFEHAVVKDSAVVGGAATTVAAVEETADLQADSVATPRATGLEGRLQQALEARSWVAFLLVFLGGVLSSLTPCVYPVIPITISFIGARSKGKLHGFVQSLFFVAGMALVYSGLGLMAAVTGGSFGAIGQSPVVQSVIAGIFLVFAASMFGAFEMQLPSSISEKLQSGDKSGPLGAVLMGAITGFIAAPCVGPIIAALLVFIASTQSLFLGFFLMLCYALGMGVLFLVIGTFAGALNSLPGAGGWMETVKKFFGVVMVAMAVYFLREMIPAGWMPWLAGAGLVIFGVFTGAFDPVDESSETSTRFFKAAGWIALLVGARFLIFGFGGAPAPGAGSVDAPKEELAWTVSSPEADQHVQLLAAASGAGRPVMVDFWATWCAQCKELDHKTWTDPAVVAEGQRFDRIKMDMTNSESPWAKSQNSGFQVVGMPTVIFYSSTGQEVKRFTGFKEAGEVLEIMKSIP
jgi:thiol:disulfide interchange protein DsbD